jgi:hypothetical protein
MTEPDPTADLRVAERRLQAAQVAHHASEA